jgi:hypothetical protein
MRRPLSVLLLATFAATALGGCAPTVPPTPSPGTPTVTVSPVPTPTARPATGTPPASPTAPVALKVYFIFREKVQPATRMLAVTGQATLRGAIEALLAGPSASERAGGLGTVIPTGTKLLGATVSANVAVLDFNAALGSGGGSLSVTDRIAQIVYTATQFPTVKAVAFKIEGKTIKWLGGEGVMVDPPRTRKTCEGETPAILIEDPTWRGTLRSGDAIKGTANVFEGVLKIEIRDAAGTLVSSKTVQATSGTGTRGTWSVIPPMSGAKAGVGTIRVFTDSPKDGTAVDVVKVPVILLP